jgi:hypothetical protein
MIRSATVAVVLAAASALGSAPDAVASPSAQPTETLTATVTSAGPQGYRLKLTDDGEGAGQLNLTACGEGSATSYYCSGSGNIPGLHAQGRVRIRWHCPPDKSCAGTAHGLIKNNGNVLATLTVKAGVRKFQTEGATFTVTAEMTPE